MKNSFPSRNSCRSFSYEAEQAKSLPWTQLLSLSKEVAASYNVTSQRGSLKLLCPKFERTIDAGRARPSVFIPANAVISSALSLPNRQRGLGDPPHSHSHVREIFTMIWRIPNLLSLRECCLKCLQQSGCECRRWLRGKVHSSIKDECNMNVDKWHNIYLMWDALCTLKVEIDKCTLC